MIKLAITMGSAMFLAAGLGACATEKAQPVVKCSFPSRDAPAPGTALVAQEYGQISGIPLDAVQFTDALKKKVAVQTLSAARTPTNTVQVTARLVNCTDSTLVVGARINFMDKNQVPSEEQSVWQNVIMSPRAIGLYQVSSTSKGAEHYVIELRDVQNQ